MRCRIDGCNEVVCPLVSIVLILISKHIRISRISWKNVSHWKNLKFIWHFFKLLSLLVLPQYKGNMTSKRLCSSLQITINSSLNSMFFDFDDNLILRNIKNVFLVFLLYNISTFDVYFLEKCFHISHVSVKLVIAIEENWMKVEHVQLFYN